MKKQRKNSKQNKAGFTLIEVLLVVVIIGIIVAIVAPRLSGRSREAQISAAKGSLENVSLAIDMYEVDNGSYPASLQSLITKGSEPNWKGPYLRKAEMPLDPWQNPLIYKVTESGYTLSSAGPDGATGTSDDIVH